MLIETHELTKRYGSFSALEQCSLGVQRGEVYGLLGPNGAGKTTLLRLLLGFLRPTSGSATVAGLDCYRQRVAVHHKLCYLPGDARLFRHMRGSDVLRFFAEVRSDGNLTRSREIAEQLELDLTRRVAFMSTGMRQKLALAACLATETPLLILDEPTANLDPTVRGMVLEMIAQSRDRGRTVVFSSHVLSEIEEVCDRVAILRRGRLVHTQAMSDLRRRHRIRAQLSGSLPASAFDPAHNLSIRQNGNGELIIDTPDELSPLLGWLSTLPLAEVRVEPIGLRSIYDQFHSEKAIDEPALHPLTTSE